MHTYKTILHLAAQIILFKINQLVLVLCSKPGNDFSILLKAKATHKSTQNDLQGFTQSNGQNHTSLHLTLQSSSPVHLLPCLALPQPLSAPSPLVTPACFYFKALLQLFPLLGNILPADIHSIHFFTSFRSLLKGHLLREASTDWPI